MAFLENKLAPIDLLAAFSMLGDARRRQQQQYEQMQMPVQRGAGVERRIASLDPESLTGSPTMDYGMMQNSLANSALGMGNTADSRMLAYLEDRNRQDIGGSRRRY